MYPDVTVDKHEQLGILRRRRAAVLAGCALASRLMMDTGYLGAHRHNFGVVSRVHPGGRLTFLQSFYTNGHGRLRSSLSGGQQGEQQCSQYCVHQR